MSAMKMKDNCGIGITDKPMSMLAWKKQNGGRVLEFLRENLEKIKFNRQRALERI